MSENSITVTPNQRIIGSYFINNREIIDLSSGVFNDQNPATSRPDATETIINNIAKGGRVYLGPALFSTIKRISLIGTFSVQLYTYKDTFILDTNNSPSTLVYDPIADIWNPAGATVETPATMRQNSLALIQRPNILIGSGFTSNISFGSALDLSSGAPTQIVTDPLLLIGASANYGQLGSAYVYRLSDNTAGLTFQESITLSLTTNRDTTSGTFIGTSVAITDDSTFAFSGFPQNNDSRGSVLFYELGNNQYTLMQEINNTVATGTQIGTSLAVSKGNELLAAAVPTTLVAGGIGLFGATGAVIVYRRSNTTNLWTEFIPPIIDPASPATTNFATSLSITDDVRYFAVGSPGNGIGVGRVYIYREIFINTISIGYTLDATIVVPDNIGAAAIGTSVKIMGSTATSVGFNSSFTQPRVIFGGPNDNAGVGAIWVYQRNIAGSWVQLQKILPAGFVTAGATGLGNSVDIAADMSTIIGGRPIESGGQGAIYIYNYSATTSNYVQASYKLPNNTIGTSLGTRVVISRDKLMIHSAGSNVMFSFNTVNGIYSFLRLFPAAVNPGIDAQGTSCFMNSIGDVTFIGAPGLIPNPPIDFNRAGAVIISIKDGSDDFFQQLFLRPGDIIGTAGFGACIAGSLDCTRMYFSGPTDNANVGAFWYYSFPNAAKNDFTNFTSIKVVKPAAPVTTRFGLTLRCDNNGESIVAATADNTRAVWTFYNNGTTITQVGAAITSATAGFACAIDITGDGLTLAIGDFTNDRISIYNRVNKTTAWVFSANITKAGTRIGISLSISADSTNNTVLITTPLTTATNMFVFRRATTAAAWTEIPVGGIPIPSNVVGIVGEDFNTCCINSDGNTFIVSTLYSLAGLINRGQCWIYQKKTDESWVLKGELIPRGNINFGLPGSSYADIPNYLFGVAMPRTIYLNSRGNKALIGAPAWGGTSPVASGAVFYFS